MSKSWDTASGAGYKVLGMDPLTHHESPFLLTFLIELPFDLHLKKGITVPAYERATEVEASVFRVPESPPPGLEIDTRLVFRRSRPEVSERRTLAMDVFEDFWENAHFVDSVPAREEIEQRPPATVVAATTATLRQDPETGRIDEETISQIFEKVLRQLNDFLTMFGFCTGSRDIGAVRRTELPSHIPAVLDFRPRAEETRRLELITLQLHAFDVGIPPSDEDTVRAVDLACRDRLSEWPFRSVVVLVHRAQRDLYAGDYEQAVIGLTTATEILCEGVIAAVMRARGDGSRLDGVLQAGLTNLIRDHITPLLIHLRRDPNVAVRWLRDCYQLRKKVAHEAYMPLDREAALALEATLLFAGTIGSALRDDPTTFDIGDQLPFTASA
jgi:hypothetical protein